jgi:signal transduction histidine kinase
LHTWLFIPLVIREKVIGLLLVVHEEKDFFDNRVREFIQAFANQMALAIENSQLYQQAQDKAVIEERNRLARDLHDSVTQTLYSINLFTNAAKMALTAGNTAIVQGHLAELGELITEAMLDMRLLIFELRPPVLEELGLTAALQARLEAVEERAGVTVNFAAEGDQNNLPLTTQVELYRVTQEALTNIIKHAGAKNITVRLIFTNTHAWLTIEDNGTGFDLKNAEQSGKLGLRSMTERVESINGQLQINSAPGQGTTIQVKVNLRSS